MPNLTNPQLVNLPCTVRSDGSLEVKVVTGSIQPSLTHPASELTIDIDEAHSGTCLQVPDIEQDNIRYVLTASTLEGAFPNDSREYWTRNDSAVATGTINGEPEGRLRTIEVTAIPDAYIAPSSNEPPLDTAPKKTTIRIRIHEKGIRPIS
jgi:hypothetical protein